MSVTNLREADAILRAQGVLAEKKLELTQDNGVDKIVGYLVLKISETDSVSIGVNVAAKKSNGQGGYTNEDNKIYAGMKTVMNEYRSIADVGAENANIVRITNGKIRPYYNVKSDKEVMSYSSNFFKTVNPDEVKEFYAQFEIEAYIDSIIPEMFTSGEHQGFQTGRAIVKGWLPTFTGIEPVEFIAPEEDGIAEVMLNGQDYTKGMTVKFYGNIINRRIEKTTTTPVKIGKPRVTTTYTYTNELVIDGLTEPYGEGTSENLADQAFDTEAVNLAIQERESYIAQKKAQGDNGKSFGGSYSNKPASSGRKLPF